MLFKYSNCLIQNFKFFKIKHSKIIIVILLIILNFNAINAQVGIGTDNPDNSSILEIESIDKGILIPRLTTSNRVGMANVQGMLVYDKTVDSFFYNDGVQWISIMTSIGTQAGTENINSTSRGWQYYNVTFSTPFNTVPSVILTYREGTGINNSGSNTITQIKTANISVTGFTIGIYDSRSTSDVYIDWIATKRTQ